METITNYPLFSLTNRNALVTGATGGLGTAIADALARQGAGVFIGYHTKASVAECLGKELSARYGIVAEPVQLDVNDETSVKQAVDSIIHRGKSIDILVNNAGIPGPMKKMEDISYAEMMETLATDLVGPFLMIKSVVPHMKQQGYGRIINLGSVSGSIGEQGLLAYASAKAGLGGLTKTAAREAVGKEKLDITVNQVNPGYTTAGMMRLVPEKILEKKIAAITLGRLGRPEEVAAAVAFLASREAGYLTGQIIAVNGGVA